MNELIGDYVSLKDVPRYGIVTDVIFSDQGKARAVVVHRGAADFGAPGPFAYPSTRTAASTRAPTTIRCPTRARRSGASAALTT